MRPRFGQLTRVLAGVLLFTGAGACFVGATAGHQSTPGAGNNGVVLLMIGLAYLVAGVGLWAEALWAWWLGAGLSAFVVVMDVLLGIHDGGLLVWSTLLAAFIVSLAQGSRSRAGYGR